jgi:6-phosphogluconolactonase
VDRSGRFAYVSNWNDGSISEYAVSVGGALAPNGSVSTGGFNPLDLAVFPSGAFLYCANENSGSVAGYSIDASTGELTLVHQYVIWVQPQGGPLWITFDPNGAYAYVGNDQQIAEFTVDQTTGALASNGTIPTPNAGLWGGVDPSGRFVFTTGDNGTVSRFIISNAGTLTPSGSVSLGPNMIGQVLTFAQR